MRMNKTCIVIALTAVVLVCSGCYGSKNYRLVRSIHSSLAESDFFIEITASPYRITTGKIRLPTEMIGRLRTALVGLREAKEPLEKTQRHSDFKLDLFAKGMILESWVPVDDHWFYVIGNKGSTGEVKTTVRQCDKELHAMVKTIFDQYAMKPIFTIDGVDIALSVDEIEQKGVGVHRLFDKDGHLLEVTSVRRDGVQSNYHFYPSGHLRVVKQYLGGVLHGQYIRLFESGAIEAIMPYEQGELNGVRIFFDKQGKVISRVVFCNGKQMDGLEQDSSW